MAKKLTPWIWVGAAFLIASTRLTELGLSLDPALFSAIARNLARDNQWWSLHASPSVFPQFHEHPYFAIWLQAIVFKLFGASDFTSRLLGLGFGCFTFYYLYRLGELLVDDTYANVFCFVTLLSVYFTGRIPTFYLDVPLCFFLVGGFYYFLKVLQTERALYGILGGSFLGCAVMTKGLAVLPVFALIATVGLIKRRQYLFRITAVWILAGLAVGIPFLVVLLQKSYGTFSFIELYNRRFSSVELMKRAGGFYLLRTFSIEFFKNHCVHLLLGGVGLVFFAVKRVWVEECRDVFWIAPIALFLLLLGNSAVGSYNLHYFYVIFPFANLLTAAALYPLARHYSEVSLPKVAIYLGLAYQIFWHILPMQMRRKPDIDFFDLKAPVVALKKAGVENLESVGIDTGEWIYREVSIWYWDIDTILRNHANEIKGQAVIVPNEKIGQVSFLKEARLCHGSKKYSLFVFSAKLDAVCRSAILDAGILR